MSKAYCNYQVHFSFDGASLKEIEDLYQLLVKNISQDMKTHFQIEVIDTIGGKHQTFESTGTQPDGTICEQCSYIDCQMCDVYLVKERQRNGKS